jgi:hypothetical protein
MPGNLVLPQFARRPGNPLCVPAGPVRINRANELTSGLVGAWLPGLYAGRNLGQKDIGDLTIGYAPASHTGGTPVYRTTKEGPAWRTNNDAGGLSLVPVPAAWETGNAWTLYWRGFATSIGNVGIINMERNSNTNQETSPFVIVSISWNGSSVGAAWNNGTFQSGSTFTLTQPNFAAIGATFKVGGNVKLFVNGVKRATNSFGAGSPSTNVGHDSFHINDGSYTGSRTNDASPNLALIWTRELSEFEFIHMDANPYQVFSPIDTMMPAMFLSAQQVDWCGSPIFRVRMPGWGDI